MLQQREQQVQRLRGQRTEVPLGNWKSLSGSSAVDRQGTQRRAGGTAVPEKGLQITRWLPASHRAHLLKSWVGNGPSSGKATSEKAEGHQGTTRPAISGCLPQASGWGTRWPAGLRGTGDFSLEL